MMKQLVLVGVLLAAITLIVGLEQQSALAGTSSQNRGVGFSDGCNGVPLTEGHTQSYLDVYSEGQAKCHANEASGVGGSDSGGSNSIILLGNEIGVF